MKPMKFDMIALIPHGTGRVSFTSYLQGFQDTEIFESNELIADAEGFERRYNNSKAKHFFFIIEQDLPRHLLDNIISASDSYLLLLHSRDIVEQVTTGWNVFYHSVVTES